MTNDNLPPLPQSFFDAVDVLIAEQSRMNGENVCDEVRAYGAACAAAERERLFTEIASLRKDSERIDYIESNARCDPKMDGKHVWWPTSFNHRLIGPNLREAIDEAMKP